MPELIEKLIKKSHPYLDPLVAINWDLFDLNSWWLPPAALSLHGIDSFEILSEEQKKRVSHFELINFIEKALWLENIFMTRISRHLTRPLENPLAITYQLQEVREEAGHSLMFMELIRRTQFELKSSYFKRPKIATWVGLYAPYQSSLFWLSVVIGEKVPNQINQYIRKNRTEVSELIYQIITKHAIDEARHVAYAKETLQKNKYLQWMQNQTLSRPIINIVFKQFIDTFFYPKAELYEAAGLSNGKKWEHLAAKNPLRKTFIYKTIDSTISDLKRLDISISWI